MNDSETLDLLKCELCHSIYDTLVRKPKFLVCHHCFCTPCLEAKLSDKSIICPNCGKCTMVKKSGISSLADNVFIIPLLNQNKNNNSTLNTIPKSKKKVPVSTGIWCKTCLKISSASCIEDSHDIVNYKTGISKLKEDLNGILGDALSSLESGLAADHYMYSMQTMIFDAVTNFQDEIRESVTTYKEKIEDASSKIEILREVDANKIDDDKELVEFFKFVSKIKDSLSTDKIDEEKNVTFWKGMLKKPVSLHMEHNLVKHNMVLDLNSVFQKSKPDKSVLAFLVGELLFDTYETQSSRSSTSSSTSDVEQHKASWDEHYNKQEISDRASSTLSLSSLDDLFKPIKKTREQTVPIPRGAPNQKVPRCYFDFELNEENIGRVIFALRPDVAPRMCKNFIELCSGKHGFGYKNSKIFKTYTKKYILGGDFINNDGTGGHSIFGAMKDGTKGMFCAEKCSLVDTEGAIRMKGMGQSNTGEALIGSQFQIWIGNPEMRAYRFTLVIGHVVQGLDVCKRIGEVMGYKVALGQYGLCQEVLITDCGTL